MADLFGDDDESDTSGDALQGGSVLGGGEGDGKLLEISLLKSFEGEQGMGVASQRAVVSKLAKEGYIEGKSGQEKVEMQEGFDEGFERGQKLGRLCGRMYGELRAQYSKALLFASSSGEGYRNENEWKARLQAFNDAIKTLEKLLFYDFPQCLKSRSLEQDAGNYLSTLYGDKIRSQLVYILSEETIELFMRDLNQIC